MNWYGTNGTGSQVAAGDRADGDAMCGNAVMYDATAGKILVVGGAIDYVYLSRCLEFTANHCSHVHSKAPMRRQMPMSSRSVPR